MRFILRGPSFDFNPTFKLFFNLKSVQNATNSSIYPVFLLLCER
jgi:hypothetical protein